MSYISVDKISKDFGRPASRTERPSRLFLLVKRTVDLGLAIALLPLVLLIGLGVILLNPFLNPGPLMFNQVRMGRNEKPFLMFKFRTMTGRPADVSLGADERHRVTRFGAFMRSKRVDELPQIFNILLGDMSFIGPRPEQIEHYDQILRMIPHYGLRQIVRPGISGLAQVESGYARNAEELRAKLRWDMHYVRNMNPGLDFYIVLRTFKVLVTGFGAR